MANGPTALSGTERILIVRTSAMGDIVHALPALSRLRTTHPGLRIGWVVERAFAGLLDGHPDIDELIPVDLRTWRRSIASARTWREVAAFSEAMSRFSPDLVLDLMGTHKSGVIAAWTLADRRIGLRRRDRREPSSALWLSEAVAGHGRHAVDRMLSVVDGVGVSGGPVEFRGERLPANPWSGGPESGAEFALLHPMTAWSNKSYPLGSWSEAIRSLKAETGLDTWVAWGPGEEETAREIASSAGARALEELASLPQLTALSRAARIVLGGDTGPLHLAHAQGTAVVCVMGPTDPETNGPYGAPESVVVHRLPCSFCHQRLDGARACLLAITPAEIVEAAVRALG